MHADFLVCRLNFPIVCEKYCILTAGSYFSDLFQAYSQDMCVKESVVGDITKQNDRDVLTVYLMCWLHQPYITSQCTDKLEALLMDSGLRT